MPELPLAPTARETLLQLMAEWLLTTGHGSREKADAILGQHRAEVLADLSGLLQVIRAALEELPEVCRYHGVELEPTGGSWMSRRESCCDTGRPAMRRRDAMDALDRIETDRG